LLIALPFAVLITGCRTLLRSWRHEVVLHQATRQLLAAIRANLPTLLVAGATFVARGILAIVVLHLLSDTYLRRDTGVSKPGSETFQ